MRETLAGAKPLHLARCCLNSSTTLERLTKTSPPLSSSWHFPSAPFSLLCSLRRREVHTHNHRQNLSARCLWSFPTGRPLLPSTPPSPRGAASYIHCRCPTPKASTLSAPVAVCYIIRLSAEERRPVVKAPYAQQVASEECPRARDVTLQHGFFYAARSCKGRCQRHVSSPCFLDHSLAPFRASAQNAAVKAG